MIAADLMPAIDSVADLRIAYGNDPYFRAVVTDVLNAANHGSDDLDQLRILLTGLATVGEALRRTLDGLAAQMSTRPAGPWLIRVDGTLVEYHPEGGPP